MIGAKTIKRPQLVLVVDDQEINRDALEIILEDDYEVITAENGQEALNLMHERDGNLSLVLLDLMMPVMDGYEVLARVHEDEQLKHVPIIVLTADKSAELRALELGAADFITKPFDMPEVILARVGRIIELSEGRQLISSAETDRISMLYSRNFFFEYADRLFQYHSDLHLGAIVLNIEQFHTINAVNGREFGDVVLRIIGDEIHEFLEGTEGIACRFEADQFFIYCIHQPDYRALLEQFQEEVSGFFPSVSIRLRMGVAPWREGIDPIVLFDRAKAACDMVRGDYSNPFMIFDEDMLALEVLNQRLLDDLESAQQQKQLKVYYQPKYDIQCDPPRLSSAEALVRWKHPNLGMISPGVFIPLFEGNGLISVVDTYVWKEAAAQVAKWRDEYGVTLPVSVNLSRADVFDPLLEKKLVRLIQDNGLSFKDIKLEVTESAYTHNAEELLEVIHRLRQHGFEIEMDDFGSGYSSLNMLSDMPIDVLKMDMKFVRNIEENEKSLRLVMLILDIASSLDLRVVAEGVETEGQLALLRDTGCNLVQGFLFSKPVPPDEFEKLIQREIETERNTKK